MATHRLKNYLKKYRKQKGFSQEHVAFLLGFRSSAVTCRYEQFERIPSLEEALAYEYILQVPVRELFAGMFEEARLKARIKMDELAENLAGEKPSRVSRNKAHKRLVASLQFHLYNLKGDE